MVRRKTQGSQHSTYAGHIRLRPLLQLIVFGLVIYIVVAGLSGLQRSWQALASANLALIGLAVLAIAVSYMFAALTYVLLAPKPLSYPATLLVQMASGLVNRLLPAGLGGLGLNALYLRKRGYNLATASTIVATNNLLGFIGNALLVSVAVGFLSVSTSQLQLPDVAWPVVAIAGSVGGLLIVFVIRSRKLHKRLSRLLVAVRNYMHALLAQPGRSALALMSSIILTALHVAALQATVLAVGADASWGVALIAVSAGALAGAALPTPGGIGGAEAGLAVALIAYGVPASLAVPAVLAYRGITYWAPLAPGYLALRVVEKRYL